LGLIRIEAAACQDLEAAMGREWLVTNGLGGYASGTVAGANTRRYHGLLVAAMTPPVQRVVLLAALEEWLVLEDGELAPLSTQEYWDGTVFPRGYLSLQRVELEGTVPVFTWVVAGRTLEKRIWMDEGQNRTVITYALTAGPPARLRLQPMFAHRGFHSQRHGAEPFDVVETAAGWEVTGGGFGTYISLAPAGQLRSRPDWYWRFLHRAERERGLDDEEDLFTPGTVEVPLTAAPAALVASTEPLPRGFTVDASRTAAERSQTARLASAGIDEDNALAHQLVLASGQFGVVRTDSHVPATQTRSVIAGYHWFDEWGRDTMISLPGLTLATGRPEEARQILETYLALLDQGMLPNFLPLPGQAVAYNTMDATLWLFPAIQAYVTATDDWDFVGTALPDLEEVIRWHVSGTRYQIRMDPADGLLSGGEEGVALTWMDARVGDWVVTPRRGKPVEINALWYNALRLLADWRSYAGLPEGPFRRMADQTRASAQKRFWYERGGYLFDVVDGPDGDDASLRPNQVVALGLAYPLLDGDEAKKVLAVVTKRLLTPFGLRTLDPGDPRYQAVYRGDQQHRDAAYHMGMVWPWLLGPYCDAHLRFFGNRHVVHDMLQSFVAHLAEAGLGSISEIFEPEPPFRPMGCIAQAWSVAEILRHAIQASRPGPI
jgi:predicted glycogen debranching enzyme